MATEQIAQSLTLLSKSSFSLLCQLVKKKTAEMSLLFFGLFVCLFHKWLRLIGGNGSILVLVFLSLPLSPGLLLLVYLTNAGPHL